ncbi:hypothetical protein DFH09DRAFT_1445651 [Mycena vulgaris]|nr:hypothetical protein DFH09DRAFT_1445651 [Mycena vulgaris]
MSGNPSPSGSPQTPSANVDTSGAADRETTDFWARVLADVTMSFVFGETVGGPGDLGTLVDIMVVTLVTEDEIARRVEHALQTRANELPAESKFIIRGDDFEVAVFTDEQRRPDELHWTRGRRDQESISSDPRFMVRGWEVLDAVNRGDISLPAGGHIFPCSIESEDGAYTFNPAGWFDPYQADPRRFFKNRGADTPGPTVAALLPTPSDATSTPSAQSDSHWDTSSDTEVEYTTAENVADDIPRPRDQDPGNGPAQPEPDHDANGGGPHPWHGRPQYPVGLPNQPAVPPNVPPPNNAFPWAGAPPALRQAPQIPVAFPWNRTVHIPFVPAHQWGTLYGPHRRVARRTPRLMIAPKLPIYPVQCFAPPPQHYPDPLNPDLAGPMKWRIFLPPGTARMPRRGTGPVLQAHVTSPPCFGVAIMFENSSLMHWAQRWGPIRVPVHSRPITVGDVLGAIHSYVSQPLTQADLSFVVPQDRSKVEEACRVRQLQGYPHVRTVPLRSDVFNNSVIFGGMKILSVSGQNIYMALRLFPDY